jgi:hypothetical protein
MITRDSGTCTRYTVQRLPDIGQVAPSREFAVTLARGFAQARAINVWYSDETTPCLREAYRQPQTTDEYSGQST